MSTPGFKRQLRSADVASSAFDAALARVRVDMGEGKVTETGRSLDLAINGDGFFQLRAGDQLVYSRQGAFSLDAEGRVVTPQGYVLQQAGGGDLTLDTAAVTISSDGNVLDGDRPVGRIGVFRAAAADDASPIDGSLFSMTEDSAVAMDTPSLRQGALEASNVSLGNEMVGMMSALRGAETGAKLVQVYDDLMGKAITTFGEGGR